jgi:hypothetical protein
LEPPWAVTKRGKRKKVAKLETVKKLAADMRRNAGLYNMDNLFRGFEWRPLMGKILEKKQVGPGPFQ